MTMVGVVFFIIAVALWVFYFIMKNRWKKSLLSSMGEWIYDAERDMTFWKWDEDVYSALVELDEEFPVAKVLQ